MRSISVNEFWLEHLREGDVLEDISVRRRMG